MRAFIRWSASLAFCLLSLSACKPSGTPPSSPSGDKSPPAATRQPSFSGQYDILSTPQATEPSNKIEVLEFFGYFCSHCKSLDPALTAWAQKNRSKIVFKRIPVAFRDDALAQQRMYFALEAMGKLESLHPRLFQAVQEERLALSNEGEIVAYLAKQGIDTVTFKAHFSSAPVLAKVANAAMLQTAYQVNSVPLIALDGRYLTSATHALKRPNVPQTEAGVHAAMLTIADELVAKSLAEKQSRK